MTQFLGFLCIFFVVAIFHIFYEDQLGAIGKSILVCAFDDAFQITQNVMEYVEKCLMLVALRSLSTIFF